MLVTDRYLVLACLAAVTLSCASRAAAPQPPARTGATAVELLPADPAIVVSWRPDELRSLLARLPPLNAFVAQASSHGAEMLAPLVGDREIAARLVEGLTSLGAHRDDGRAIYFAFALTTDQTTRRSRRLGVPPSEEASASLHDVLYRLVVPLERGAVVGEDLERGCGDQGALACRVHALDTTEGPVMILDIGGELAPARAQAADRSAPAWQAVHSPQHALAVYVRFEAFFDLRASRAQAALAEALSEPAPADHRQWEWARGVSRLGALSLFDNPQVAEFEEVTFALSTSGDHILFDLVADMTPYGAKLFDALRGAAGARLAQRTFASPAVDVRVSWDVARALAEASPPMALRHPFRLRDHTQEPVIDVMELVAYAQDQSSLAGLGLLRSPLSWLRAFQDGLLFEAVSPAEFAWPSALWLQVGAQPDSMPALAAALGFDSEPAAHVMAQTLQSRELLNLPPRIHASEGGGEVQFAFPLSPEDLFGEEREGLEDGLMVHLALGGIYDMLSSLPIGRAGALGQLRRMLGPEQRPGNLDYLHVRAAARQGQARVRLQLGGASLLAPTYEAHHPATATEMPPACWREATGWYAQLFTALAHAAPDHRLALVHSAADVLDEAADRCDDEELGRLIRHNAELWRQWDGAPLLEPSLEADGETMKPAANEPEVTGLVAPEAAERTILGVLTAGSAFGSHLEGGPMGAIAGEGETRGFGGLSAKVDEGAPPERGEQAGTGFGGDARARCQVDVQVLEGSLDPRIVHRVVRQRQLELRHCYEREARVRPGLRGELQVRFAIEPQGTTGAIAIAPSPHAEAEQDFEACVIERLQRWRFPAPADEDVVTAAMALHCSLHAD
jgi:hypothetical protein